VYFTNSSVKARGIILRALREHPKELSLSQIAKEVGLPKSTVQRIISSLEIEEFVITASSHNGLDKKIPDTLFLASGIRITFHYQLSLFSQGF
jgi:DNA-binding transcriptional ArsR family regulator